MVRHHFSMLFMRLFLWMLRKPLSCSLSIFIYFERKLFAVVVHNWSHSYYNRSTKFIRKWEKKICIKHLLTVICELLCIWMNQKKINGSLNSKMSTFWNNTFSLKPIDLKCFVMDFKFLWCYVLYFWSGFFHLNYIWQWKPTA